MRKVTIRQKVRSLRSWRRQTAETQNGDANAQYWLGLIAANMSERLAWWTKAAENGNTEATEGLYWGSDDLGVDKEKARYWLVKAAESNPKAMVSLR